MVKHREVPTHLDVEDRVLFGLSVRQFLYVLVGSSAAYTLWEQLGLSELPRLCIVSVCVALTLGFALFRPAGRPLEEWLAAALVYAGSPRRSTWRPPEPDPSRWLPTSNGWHELAPNVDWAEDELA